MQKAIKALSKQLIKENRVASTKTKLFRPKYKSVKSQLWSSGFERKLERRG